MNTSPKSSTASRSKTELKPQTRTRSPHDQELSNTRFDNNSTETVLENIYQNQIKDKEYLNEAGFGNLGNYEKRNKYPALGVYQTSNPSGRLVELKLGVDIGSTSSKAVIRFPYETFGPFAVPALDGLQADNNPYILAKNMGTSVEMIEKFYGHILTPDIVSSIKKTSNQSSSKNLKGTYPF